MLAWLKKIFSGKKTEEINVAVPASAPAAPEKTAAASMTGAEEATKAATEETINIAGAGDEDFSEDLK